MIIVAGPNGSGKTTMVDFILKQHERASREAVFLNADVVTKAFREQDPNIPLEVLNLRAAQYIDGLVYQYARATGDKRINFVVETVLSSRKYLDAFKTAKENGFLTNLSYISLKHPDMNVERVAERVKKGGHHVAEEKIRARYVRSHQILPEFLRVAEEVNVYDNSKNYGEFRSLSYLKVGRKESDDILRHINRGTNLHLDKALEEVGAVFGPAPDKPAEPGKS